MVILSAHGTLQGRIDTPGDTTLMLPATRPCCRRLSQSSSSSSSALSNRLRVRPAIGAAKSTPTPSGVNSPATSMPSVAHAVGERLAWGSANAKLSPGAPNPAWLPGTGPVYPCPPATLAAPICPSIRTRTYCAASSSQDHGNVAARWPAAATVR
jgi:hypothetical protein